MPYKKRKPKKAPLPDAADVLSGRVRVDPGTLIDLIVRVNPTGLPLPAREAAARYARKSALQNLLIRLCADDLEAEAEPGQEGIVSLRHRRLGRFACHVAIGDLDDDARSWVRMQLDSREAQAREDGQAGVRERTKKKADERREKPGAGRETAAAATGGCDLAEGSPAALVKQGMEALEAFDYDRARSCLEAAFEKSGGDAAPAEALLALLVDTLGACEEALALVPGLSRQARADARVRALLAAAAAHARRRDEALSWADGLTGERAAAVHLVLADQYVENGDWEQARERLRFAASLRAGPLEILAREKKIETLLALENRPHEEKLQELWEQGRVEEAACAARKILGRWPGSRPARDVLRRIESEEREREAQGLLEKAAKELARSAFAEAVEAAREASRLGGDREKAAGIIAEAQHGLERRAKEARTGAALAMLASADPSGGYLAYLDLDEDCRRLVRRQLPGRARALSWLEEAGAPGLSTKKRPAAAAAVMDLEAALEALGAGRPEETLALLQKHEDALEGVAEAGRAATEAREKIEEARIEKIRASIERAEAALAGGDPRGAMESLGPVEAARLPAGLGGRLEALLARIRGEEASRLLAARFSSCMERGDLLGAREAAQELASGSQDRQDWRARVEDVGRRIRRRFHLRVVRDEAADQDRREPVDETPNFFWSSHYAARLTADGRHMVQADLFAGRLFFRMVDVVTSRVSAAVCLVTPRPAKKSSEVDILVDEGSVWVADLGGSLLRLDLRTWDVLAWHRLEGLIGDGERLEQVLPIPGGRFAWIVTSDKDREFRTRVLDLREMRVQRELGGRELFTVYVAGPTPRMLVKRSSGNHGLTDPRGIEIGGVRLAEGEEATEASAHPGGSGLVLLAGDVRRERRWGFSGDDEKDDTLKVVAIDGQGAVRSIDRLEGSGSECLRSLVTSRSAAASFVLFCTGIGRGTPQRLAAFKASGEGLRKAYEIGVPSDCVLVGDAWAGSAVLLYRKGGAAAAVTLTGEPPDIRADPPTDDRFPMFSPGLTPPCWHLGCGDDELYGKVRALRFKSGREIDRMIEEIFEDREQTPEMLADLARALDFSDGDLQRQVIERAFALHPDHPVLAILHAETAAEEGRWGQVIEALEPFLSRRLGPKVRRHLAHLLGMARYATGDADAALELWKSVHRPGSLCELTPCINLARPLRPADRKARSPLLRRLLAAVRDADEALGQGEAGSALEAADRSAVWRAGEVQSLARLAEAFLLAEPALPMQRYRKAMALALFISHHDDDSSLRNELPLTPGRLERERLDELRTRALAWLESFEAGA